MIYCINPDCDRRQNPENLESCQACGTPLLIRDRYRLLHPLRPLDSERSTEIFEITVEGEHRVMKILKKESPKFVELFNQEAFVLEILDHPGIPKIDKDGYFQVSLNTGRTLRCLVMEKFDGENLEQWLERNGKISQKVARNWLVQLLNTLDYIHARGFFHRDLKPSNIMLKPDDRLAIIDFGAVREITDTYMIAFRGSNQPNITSIVSRGYTAPEQINGKATPQSDLFALGRTFVYLLTGLSPSELPTDSTFGKLFWQQYAPQVSKLFADLIDDLMAPLPRNRPRDSQVALNYLNNLFLRNLERNLTSPRFKLAAAWSISLAVLLGTASLIFNQIVILPLQAEVYSKKGREALMSGDLELARQNFEKAIKRNSKKPVFYNDLGLVCNLQQEYQCALDKYRESLKLAPDHNTTYITHYNLGDLYQKVQKFEAALAEYKVAMQSQGAVSISAKINYARLQIWQYQNYLESIELLQNSLKKINKFGLSDGEARTIKAAIYRNLGWAYLQKSEYQNAENNLRIAIRLDRDASAAPYCLLAKVLQARGEDKNALVFWENCQMKDAEELPEVKTWQGDANQYLNAWEKSK